MTDDRRPRFPLFALCLLLLGSVGMAAGWILFAFASDRQLSWVAVLAALDAAFLLRLGRMRPGWARAACGALATAATIALANFGIAAAQMGRPAGLLPWESMGKLGPHHAWTLATLANPLPELAWLAAALVIAAVASR
jgi:hypothetical protein